MPSMSVERSLPWRLLILSVLVVRFVVDAVAKYPVPLAEMFVVEAPPLNVWSADQLLAVVVPKPSEKLPVPVL